MKKISIFLTGSKGFIGRNIYEQLKNKYLFLRPSSKELDLTDSFKVDQFFKKNKVDIIVHCACLDGSRKAPYVQDSVERNLRMFFNLVKNKKYFKQMIHFGSGAEFNKELPIKKIKEEDFGKNIPLDQYGFFKYICSNYAKNSEKILVLRLFGVYGKYEDYEIRFISNNIVNSLSNLPLTINQNAYFDYLYIDDLVKIVEFFIKNKPRHKIYNVGTGKRTDLLTIAKKINLISSKKQKIITKNKGFKNEYTCSNSLLLKEIGNFKFTDIDRGIKELYCWYDKNKTKRIKSLIKINL